MSTCPGPLFGYIAVHMNMFWMHTQSRSSRAQSGSHIRQHWRSRWVECWPCILSLWICCIQLVCLDSICVKQYTGEPYPSAVASDRLCCWPVVGGCVTLRGANGGSFYLNLKVKLYFKTLSMDAASNFPLVSQNINQESHRINIKVLIKA